MVTFCTSGGNSTCELTSLSTPPPPSTARRPPLARLEGRLPRTPHLHHPDSGNSLQADVETTASSALSPGPRGDFIHSGGLCWSFGPGGLARPGMEKRLCRVCWYGLQLTDTFLRVYFVKSRCVRARARETRVKQTSCVYCDSGQNGKTDLKLSFPLDLLHFHSAVILDTIFPLEDTSLSYDFQFLFLIM